MMKIRRVFGLVVWSMLGTVLAASGTEVKGVIATQTVSPGDYMNPAFTGKIDINIHFPTSPNAQTGLMAVLHGLGTDFHSYDSECESWVNDYNVLTVQINFRNTLEALPGNDFAKYQAVDVLRVVQYMMAHYTINKQRVFLWGASAGGFVALHTAMMAPHTFAMVAALSAITRPTNDDDRNYRGYENDPSGGWEPYVLGTGLSYSTEEWDIRDAQYQASFLQGIPVFLIHGDQDPVVDIQHARDMHTALLAAGCTVTLREIDGGDHEFHGAAPTEDSRFEVTQNYLATPLNTLVSDGANDLETQSKVTFPTQGNTAWPVKFDAQGLITLDAIAKPGAVVNLRMTEYTVKHGESLSFGLKIDNWAGEPQATVLLAGYFQMNTASVLPLLGPTPFLLPTVGVEGPVALPITSALPPGDYLVVLILVGSLPSSFIDLDFFQFTVVSASS